MIASTENLSQPNPYAWKRRFDEKPLKKSAAMGSDRNLKLLWEMLPAIYRIMQYHRKESKRGRAPIMDFFRSIKVSPDLGVPLGGLGSGTVTRGFRGDFLRWQMQPGLVQYSKVLADQFSLWVRRGNAQAKAIVLNPTVPEESSLTGWQWGFPAEQATYHALFPRAWTVYEGLAEDIHLTCRQVSPVIPHNYRESSFPAGVFVWTIENTGTNEAEAALMFTFQNGIGQANDLAGGHSNHLVRQPAESTAEDDEQALAIELRHLHRQPRPLAPGQKLSQQTMFTDPLTFAIAVQAAPGVEPSYRTRFIANSNGLDVWADFAADGALDNLENDRPASAGLSIGAALAARVKIPAGESRQVVFSLAWDMPVARFSAGTGWYRRYTRFYGREGKAAAKIACDALSNYPAWEQKIAAWQQPILEDVSLPDWYKAALFNETYYLVDGGTIWTDGEEMKRDEVPLLPEPEYGHFAYLESHEYRMYNTADVHFYASYALAMLWPELELSLQRDFIHSLDVEHPEQIILWLSGKKAARKARGIIPHDLGSPASDPWRQVNAYMAQDVSRWKDLNSKFVLMIYRDYLLSAQRAFLEEAWPAVQRAVEKLGQFDRDGDGMIENDGYPDQTYDVWSVSGVSAYTGGLWLACLGAAAAMADVLGKQAEAESYRQHLQRAQKVYEEKLWNGEYYNYDSSASSYHNSIMADQLCGQWYARSCGLPDVVPPENARLALKKIFDFNVKRYQDGESGAVNGMRPEVSADYSVIDQTSMQSQEMWTGTTFGLAACMYQEGLVDEAFYTARGVTLAVYCDYGLFFQTPESLTKAGVYRATAYMRPLAIWAIQWAHERKISR